MSTIIKFGKNLFEGWWHMNELKNIKKIITFFNFLKLENIHP